MKAIDVKFNDKIIDDRVPDILTCYPDLSIKSKI